jgi:hypothetical protein
MDIRFVQNIEVVDIIEFINRKKRLHQKLMLNGIEEVLGKDTVEYQKARKVILDNSNDFARSIVRSIFGDSFEGVIK